MWLSPLLLVIGMLGAVLGVPFGLYAWLTRGQRRVIREIRLGAAGRGWQYRRRWWQGNPAAFRIDGRTGGGLDWIMTSGNSGVNESRWSAEVSIRFPMLTGEENFGVDRAAPPDWPADSVALRD